MSISPTPITNPVRAALHDVLQRWSPAAGATGFEGLVAHALATLTGFTFRLARSGSQFGRDAASPNAPFSIAMEAKRYTDSVPLQELVGKASLAAAELADGIDLWALAATVEVSEPTQRSLDEILERDGITLLTLDWTNAGLPPLAVLLAAVRSEVVEWATPILDPAGLTDLKEGLDDIAGDPAFDTHRGTLEQQLSPALLGLDAFRKRNAEWCAGNFSSSKLAQRSFSQFLTPMQAPETIVERPIVRASIAAAIETASADVEGDSLVAVLGADGCGKTWSVANWWLGSASKPILMPSIGRIADQLSAEEEPLEMLARLAAHQDSRRDRTAVSRWRRRLDRWSRGDHAPGRFIVLVDGLNETSGKPWAAILRTLMPAVRSLGGIVVTTCREGYWCREVEDRLPGYVTVVPVEIRNYDDAEFTDILARNKVDPDSLPVRLNQFMRNPRICALALTLLPQLSGIEDMSVDRLLLEYWRHRLREREDLIGHSDEDFRDLLVRHAKDYRERPGTDFDRNEWRSRSGAAARQDGRDLAHDLTDIEEGHFFDGFSRRYQFRTETLHFALGLLVADELAAALRSRVKDLDEAVAAIIDPIRGFDIIGDIMTAAVAVSALDQGYADAGIAALVRGWMSLQNLGDEAFDGLIPYVAARPDPFIDAWEHRHVDSDDGRFFHLLLSAAQRENVARALDARLDRWLGSWSRRLPDNGHTQEDSQRQKNHEAQIAERLAGLTGDEQRYLSQRCTELPASALLASAAAHFLYGRPLAGFASGIVAFAFTYMLARNSHTPYENVSWVIRLNRVDPAETARAVRDEIASLLGPNPSDHAKGAAAWALRLLGSLDAELDAEALNPRPTRAPFGPDRPDPLDPASSPPEDIAEQMQRVAGLDFDQIWSGMWTTGEDHDLERHRDELIRFDPDGFREVFEKLARSVTTRKGMPLRQLGWHMPWLSQIISGEAVVSVKRRMREIAADPSLVPDGDLKFVMGMMVEGVLPSLDAGAQLDLIQSLPPDAPYLLRYVALAKEMSGEEAAGRLDAVVGGDSTTLERTLFFLASSATDVTDRLRELISTCLGSEVGDVVAAAAEFVRLHDDAGFDDEVLKLPLPSAEHMNWRASVLRCAISSAVGRRGRVDLVGLISVEHLDWVAARLPEARQRLADTIEAVIGRLTSPIASDDPRDTILVLEVYDDPADTRMDLVDRGEVRPKDPLAAIEAINEEMSDDSGEKFASRRRLLNDQADRFIASLTREGAMAVASRPYTIGIAEIALEDGPRYEGWLRHILKIDDPRLLRQVQNLGFTLAQNYAAIDSALAAEVLAHLWEVESHVVVQVGDAKHSFRHLALFHASASAEIDALRRQVFLDALDDAAIGRLTVAADAAGADGWLDSFVDSCLSSDTAADNALGITVASFRRANAHSDKVLARDWGRGFLGGAAGFGLERYQRAKHSFHWFAQAITANDPHERWRFMELGLASADRRQLLKPSPVRNRQIRLVGGDLPQRLGRAVEKASNADAQRLLGQRRPTSLIEDVIR